MAKENIYIVGIKETWWNVENLLDTAILGYKLSKRNTDVWGGLCVKNG